MKTRWFYDKTEKGPLQMMAVFCVDVPGFGERISIWGVGRSKAEARRHALAKFRNFRAALNLVPA